MLSGAFCLGALAIPAKPGFIRHIQPDGTPVNIRMIGDEHGHVIFSAENLVVVNNGGRMEYAKFNAAGIPEASGMPLSVTSIGETQAALLQSKEQIEKWVSRVNDNKARRLKALGAAASDDENTGDDDQTGDDDPTGDDDQTGEDDPTGDEENPGDEEGRLVPLNFGLCSSTFPVIGEQKGLVVLVEYQDVEFTYGDHDYFHRMLNEEGFSDYGSLGSARDWFIFNSNGKFIPQFDVYGPVVLPEKRSYYGGNDFSGNDKNPEMMAVHALQILDDEVDFSEYDRDGDGLIDNVFIFYAGKGEHDSGISSCVWPHSWELSSAGHEPFIFDGVQLEHYACSCEYPSGYKRPDGMGTFVHEFSHVMGLPDLYVTTYTGGFTPGEWSVLDVGPYNNGGLTPPNYSSFERGALGWIDFLPIEEGRVEIPELSESNVAYAVPTPSANEFFFFENRQQIGNDQFIPGHGMLVWHIDYSKSVWDYNTVNNNSVHQRVDIVEADNVKSEGSRAGDAFPGTKNVTEFRCDVYPKFVTWKRKSLDYDLIDIEESEDGLISFTAITHDELHPKETGVAEVAAGEATGDCFDLMGRKVQNPSKGIYIRDGKKIVIR